MSPMGSPGLISCMYLATSLADIVSKICWIWLLILYILASYRYSIFGDWWISKRKNGGHVLKFILSQDDLLQKSNANLRTIIGDTAQGNTVAERTFERAEWKHQLKFTVRYSLWRLLLAGKLRREFKMHTDLSSDATAAWVWSFCLRFAAFSLVHVVCYWRRNCGGNLKCTLAFQATLEWSNVRKIEKMEYIYVPYILDLKPFLE